MSRRRARKGLEQDILCAGPADVISELVVRSRSIAYLADMAAIRDGGVNLEPANYQEFLVAGLWSHIGLSAHRLPDEAVNPLYPQPSSGTPEPTIRKGWYHAPFKMTLIR